MAKLHLALLIKSILYFVSSLVPLSESFDLSASYQLQQTTHESFFTESKGNWLTTKKALRNPKCCVRSVSGLNNYMELLQNKLSDANKITDLDLRMKVNVNPSSIYNDCLQIVQQSILSLDMDNDDGENDTHSIVEALMELTYGFASLADGSMNDNCDNVFVRIVCASNYKARDPMYHTDKAPLRGYVTLRGVGTQFMTRPCSPLEYLTLRSLGTGNPLKSIRQAEELEFIVMKGDHYDCDKWNSQQSLQYKLWKRSTACVHRSPPAVAKHGNKRVILSIDLGDGDDDREWYQVDANREWRSGMTQRKSHLVA